MSGAVRFLAWFGIAKILMHVLCLGRYGYHRDELYFLSCGDRLAFGYADFAPLVAWVAGLSRSVFGDSVVALRVLPLLAGVASVLLAASLARSLGGGRLAQGLTALCMLTAPVFVRTANMLSAPSFEPLFWTACALMVAKAIRDGWGLAWLGFGAAAGMGLLNKHTTLLLGLGVFLGLLLTKERRQLATRWPWLGALVAVLFFSPNLIWQATHGWPTVAFIQHLNETVMSRIPTSEFLAGQVIYQGPMNLVIWSVGLFYLAFGQGGRFRVFAWTYAVVLAVLLLSQSKIYYSTPVYPILFAAGAVAWERWLERVWSRVALVGVVAVGLALAPLSLPILPIEEVDAFAKKTTFGLVEHSHEVTGDLHDMFGWEEHARAVAEAYQSLPAPDRASCLLWGGNYGHAGAFELFWPLEDRPPVASNDMSWHFFGPPPGEWRTVLALSWSRRHLDRLFAEVTMVGRSPGHPQAMERNIPIFVCRQPRGALRDIWPKRADL